MMTLRVEQYQLVIVFAKGLVADIAHQKRNAFFLAFGGTMREQVFRLRCETHAVGR